VGRNALHRHALRLGGFPHDKQRILESREDGTIISRAFSGKTMRVLKNDVTEMYEKDPARLKPFPEQLSVSFAEKWFHLGGDESTPDVDPSREGYPAGQVVGGIDRAHAGRGDRCVVRGRSRSRNQAALDVGWPVAVARRGARGIENA
jgi:NAD(P)H-dependent flavin oxidoreductase YrpB (nitropropane dioxygenase family)